MKKGNKSHRLGIMRDSEVQYLFMTKAQKKVLIPSTVRKLHERITKGADQSFQDLDMIIRRLPKEQLDKIDFETGLSLVQRSLAEKGLESRSPIRTVEEAKLNLDSCLESIKKFNKNLKKIAEPDFELVRKWLYVIQKFPKSQGVDTT